MLRNNTIANVLRLMQSPHKYVQLAAVNFIRTVISTRDEFYFKHIIKLDMLRPVVSILRDSDNKDSLVTSSILELVDFVRSTPIMSLGNYIVAKLWDYFECPLHLPVLQVSLSLRLKGLFSILLTSYVMWSVAPDSSGVLQSYSITSRASLMTTN